MDARTLERKLKFIEDYTKASNAATGSAVDSNANVTTKNINTLQTEIGKPDIIDINRAIVKKYLTKLFPNEALDDKYESDLKNHIIYSNDETSLNVYCMSVSLYPFLLNGTKDMGGTSGPPTHAASFIGGLVNLVFLLASQAAGAIGVPETLTYLDHFLRLEYGKDYINNLDTVIEQTSLRKTTLRNKITDLFQQFVYSINQPAGARNYQSPFINISYFDKYFFESIFKDFVFPDGDEPCWETTKELQKMFMKWFNKERERAVLTFPVESYSLLTDENGKYKDEEMADFAAEMWSEGHSFFCYQSDSADTLSSCCRLKNKMVDNVFSYTLGAGGVETGSKHVITLNMNRIVQDWFNEQVNKKYVRNRLSLSDYISPIIKRVQKYLIAWNAWLWDNKENGMLPAYDAGFINLDKQYLTIGIAGFLDSAMFLETVKDYLPEEYSNIEIKANNLGYINYVKDTLGVIKQLNKEIKSEHIMMNCEQIPAENAGKKLYDWDKKAGYYVVPEHNLYNSYFYDPSNPEHTVLDKFYFQGKNFTQFLDGGAALHNNLDEMLSKKQYRYLLDVAVKAGCNYFTYNVPMYACDNKECGYVSKYKVDKCPKCGATVTPCTRIIGYLKKVSNFSEARQIEASRRYYAKDVEEV